MRKILIIGSNFGSEIYLKVIKKLFKKSKVHICSPNINKKKINGKNIIKFKNYRDQIINESYDLIICSTNPKTQYQFLKLFIKYKKKSKLMLEKPLAHNFTAIFDLLKNLKIENVIFSQNFIYPNIWAWEKFYSNIKKINGYKKINYKWHFNQAYFKNKKKTWKINNSEGGGLIFFYLPHLIYNLIYLDENLRFKKIVSLKKRGRLITGVIFKLKSKTYEIDVDISNNSKENIHELSLVNKEIRLSNLTTSWTEGFNFFKSKKKYFDKNKDNSRLHLTKKNIEELVKFKINEPNYKNKVKLFFKTYRLLKILDLRVYGKKL